MNTLTEQQLRAAFSDHRSPPDPFDIVAPDNATPFPDDWLADKREGLRGAAILVPFVRDADGGLHVLLTQRAAHLKHHAGQVSFPGGAREPGDTSLADTAIREAAEEVGLASGRTDVVGYLRPQWTISNYAMTPVIAIVDGPVDLTLQESEVADAFQVPAEVLLDRRRHRIERRTFQSIEFDTVEILWRERRIWGATATVISRITKIMENNEL